MLEAELLVGRIEEVHLVRISRHQPVDAHELGLADAMAARLGLQIVLRVPVGIVDDDRVGGRQVDAHAARARAQQEEKGIRVRRAVAVDGSLPLVASHRPVQALVAEASQLDVLLDQVEEHRELREEEHTVPLLAQVRQELVEQQHLARGGDQVVEPRGVIGALEPLRLDHTLDEERVVAAVAQLHRHVVERRAGARGFRATQEHGAVPLEDRAVAALLEVGDLDADEGLFHRREPEVDIRLGTAQQVRPKHLGEPLHLRRTLHVAVLLEKVVELLEGVGLEEVEHRPEFSHVILERRARERELHGAVELTQREQCLRIAVLETVRLVDDHVLPAHRLEHLEVRREHLIGRDTHVELGQLLRRRTTAAAPAAAAAAPAAFDARGREAPLVLHQDGARVLVAVEDDGVERGPLGKFACPMRQRGKRHDHEYGPLGIVQHAHALQHAHGLCRLPEAHLVAQDDAPPLRVVVAQPA